jgi:hypothetical protein
MNKRFWWPGVLASNLHRTLTAVIQKRLPLVRVRLRGHVPEVVHDYASRVWSECWYFKNVRFSQGHSKTAGRRNSSRARPGKSVKVEFVNLGTRSAHGYLFIMKFRTYSAQKYFKNYRARQNIYYCKTLLQG